jgi:hypothetical protein
LHMAVGIGVYYLIFPGFESMIFGAFRPF